MTDLRLAVVGASGRMGRMLVKAITEAEGVIVAGALERPGAPSLGKDAGILAGLPALGVPVLDDEAAVFSACDGIVDFTSPAATVAFARRAAAQKLIHVIGTTGLSEADLDAIRACATDTAIVQSGNMSLGLNLLAALVRRAASSLGVEYDIEVLEMHHKNKVDAPSGTALMLGQAAAEGRGITLKEHWVKSRDGHTGARRSGDIGFATLRGGSVIGDHTVYLSGPGERIELRHQAEDRGIFANGAVKAALWAKGRPPGFYAMTDVLGITE